MSLCRVRVQGRWAVLVEELLWVQGYLLCAAQQRVNNHFKKADWERGYEHDPRTSVRTYFFLVEGVT